MSTMFQPMTAEELWSLPSSIGRCELVEGELRLMSPAGGEHGQIAVTFSTRLMNYVERHDLGEVYAAETGFLIGRNPDTVRAPDTAFVAKARVQAAGRVTGYWPGPPDLALEVISPSDTLSAVDEKARTWIASGAQMVIVANPRNRTVTQYRADREPQVIDENALVDFSPVVPGFQLSVKAILR